MPNIARLFHAVHHAEKVHAGNHFRNLRHLEGGFVTVSMAGFGPGNTIRNLGLAIEGEEFEVREMYPVYKGTADLQDEKAASKSFDWAYQTERVHLSLYGKAKGALDKGKDVDLGPIPCVKPAATQLRARPRPCAQCVVLGETSSGFSPSPSACLLRGQAGGAWTAI